MRELTSALSALSLLLAADTADRVSEAVGALASPFAPPPPLSEAARAKIRRDRGDAAAEVLCVFSRVTFAAAWS